jgi:GH24 family phage-related lysozyme (muramidase)
MQQAGDLTGAQDYLDLHVGRLDTTTETRLRRQVGDALERRETLTLAEEFVHNPVLANVEAPTPSAAPDLIRGFEGFREATYWDVNHHRTGYGSDTITAADGSVREVKAGDRVSRADAERDLSRRVGEIEATAASRAGAGWRNLSDGARAAIVSVAYNYGAGHDRLGPLWAAAARGDSEAVASVIEGFAGDNDGVNRDRRKQEAQAARNGVVNEAAQAHNLENIYGAINERAIAEGWTPEKTEDVKAQAARLVDRDEQLLNRQFSTAADEAAQAIAALPNGLTDITQIPANIRSRMDPTDVAKLEQGIRDARRVADVKAQAAAQARRATELEFMKRFEPARFRALNPLEEARHLSPEKYNTFMMDYLEANEDKPFDPTGVKAGINSEIEFQARTSGLRFSEEQMSALFDFMEAQLSVIEAKKGRLENSDYADAYRTATRQVSVSRSLLGVDALASDVPTPAYEVMSEVPANIEAAIRQNWRGSAPPTKGQIISVWMQAYGGRSQ